MNRLRLLPFHRPPPLSLRTALSSGCSPAPRPALFLRPPAPGDPPHPLLRPPLRDARRRSPRVLLAACEGVRVCGEERGRGGGGGDGVGAPAVSDDLGRDGEVFKKTLRLVECAMFASVSALAYLLSNSLALENYLGCFFALPIVISSMRWGLAAGRKTMVATAVLLLTLAGPVKASTYLVADQLGPINCCVLTGPCNWSCGLCPNKLILDQGKHIFSNHDKHACHFFIHVFIYWDKCPNDGCDIHYIRSSAYD